MSSNPENFLRFQLSRGITDALRTLLGSKHLYQTLEVPSDFIAQYLEQVGRQARAEAERSITQLKGITRAEWYNERERGAVAAATDSVSGVTALPWQPRPLESDPPMPVHDEEAVLVFDQPTIQTYCDTCGARWPFNPGANAAWGSLRAITLRLSSPPFQKTAVARASSRRETAVLPRSDAQSIAERFLSAVLRKGYRAHQLFLFPYQCQQCKGAPVCFLVRRTDLKLTLCGREPLETIEAPKGLPKGQRKYFSDAVIAYHAGQTLAGLFLLRTFIEQYWRSLNLAGNTDDSRMTGEELGETYNATLPDDFKSRFPSLLDLYRKLSSAMHKADANEMLFESAVAEITEHFDARRLYKLASGSAK